MSTRIADSEGGYTQWAISERARYFAATHLALDITQFYADPIGRSGVRGANIPRQRAFIREELNHLISLASEFGLDWEKAAEHISTDRRISVRRFISGKDDTISGIEH